MTSGDSTTNGRGPRIVVAGTGCAGHHRGVPLADPDRLPAVSRAR